VSYPRYLVALITPFTAGGEIDLEAHRHNVSVLWTAGVRGFVIGGSNGEGPYLETDERRRLLAAARDVLGSDAYLMCGVMAETVRQAVRQLAEAAEGDADSVLCLTPTTLARNRVDTVEGFFSTVADESPLPLVLYSVPNTTAYSLPEESVAALAGHPGIVGMKDSSGDPVRMQRLVEATPDDFVLWSGSSQALTLAVTAGAHGVITGSGNYVPHLVLETLESAIVDPLRAMALQRRLSAASRAIESHGIPGVKVAAETAGLRPGHPRLPLVAVSDDLAVTLREALSTI
jgi:dihydrodipicolinate synthase/N-acetylneuraminate lyase